MCFALNKGNCSPAAARGVAAAEAALSGLAVVCLRFRSLSFRKKAGDGAPAHPNGCYHISPSFFQYHPKCATIGSSDKNTINKGKLAKKKVPHNALYFKCFACPPHFFQHV